MPSYEDCIHARNMVRQKAIEIIVQQEKCSYEFAEKYVNKLTDEELVKLTGVKKGGPYSAW
jgi:hypothetical protein